MKILIADAQSLTRAALAAVAAAALPDVEVEAVEACDLAGTLDVLAEDPSIALLFLDPALPDARGLRALELVRRSFADVPVVVVTDEGHPAFAQAVMQAGARAIVSKRWDLDRFRAAVRLVLVGGAFAPLEAVGLEPGARRDRIAQREWVREATSQGDDALGRLRLTPRQREVLAMLAEGYPNKTICRELRLAENTVKAHTSAIYRALGVANRTQALAALVRLGITTEMLVGRAEGEGRLGEPA
jgi:DNA-binding NarL/FixJ family response regulator